MAVDRGRPGLGAEVDVDPVEPVAETMRQITAAGWQTATPDDLLSCGTGSSPTPSGSRSACPQASSPFVPDGSATPTVVARSPRTARCTPRAAVLAAEARLLDLAARTDGPGRRRDPGAAGRRRNRCPAAIPAVDRWTRPRPR